MAKIKLGAATTNISGMQRQPRSFADYVMGKSTVKYDRSAKAKVFKPKPSSNGKGVGM